MQFAGVQTATVFLSRRELAIKPQTGVAGGLIAVSLYHGLRAEPGEIPRTLSAAIAPRALGHFPAVFLEGVALAFVFVRLRWALGSAVAVLVPALLFAIAHTPRQVSDGESPATMVIFFLVNVALPAAILLLIERGRDVIRPRREHTLFDGWRRSVASARLTSASGRCYDASRRCGGARRAEDRQVNDGAGVGRTAV